MRLLVLGFVVGTVALQREAELPALRVGLVALALWLAAALAARRFALHHGVLLLAAGALAGYGWAAWRAELRLADALSPALEGQDLEVTGVVAGLPREGGEALRFLFHRESGDAAPRVLSLAWYPARDAGPLPRLEAGQRWSLTVRLKRPRGLANPHAFDFEPWALARGIRATGYVRARPAPELLAARVDGWPYTLHRWRGEVRAAMRAHLGEAPLAGVLVALAIGDQDAIAPAHWEVFWRTGVGHLMSISGLHITMLGALAYALVAFAWARAPPLALRLPARKAGIVAALAAALAYSLFTGYQVPAQRTFCMLAAIAACVLADRHGSPSRVLAVAAGAVLLLDPWAVLAPGFWLSFGAVAAIFWVMALRRGRPARLALAAREQGAVTCAMVPMLGALFGELSLVAPLANAAAIPLVGLVVVPLALAGAFLGLGAPLDAAHAVLAALMGALEALARWPHAVLETHAPAAWTVALAVVGCAWLLAPRGVPLRACGLLWIAPMFLVGPARPAAGEAWVDVLDVGHGLAVVVRTASHALLYDAGPAWRGEADSGARIVVPYLRGEGVARLDALVISHADDDHAGGAWSVAAARAPPWLVSSLPADDPLHLAVARSTACAPGVRWRWDDVTFEVLHPAAGPAPQRKGRENDRSCVLRVAARGAAMLLTGDIGARAEAELVARDARALRAEALLVPHHGSKTSSSGAFLDAVAPRVAIASTAHRNRFGHPHESVAARYAERGIALARTDREGALRVALPAEAGARVSAARRVPAVRYWSDRRKSP